MDDRVKAIFDIIETVNAKTIQENIVKDGDNNAQAVLRNLTSESVCDVFHELIQPTEPFRKSGDVLIGFYSPTPITFDVAIHNRFDRTLNVVRYTHTLSANEFAYALGETVIPLVGRNWDEIEIILTEPVYCIHGFIGKERTYFGYTDSHYVANNRKHLYFYSGCCTGWLDNELMEMKNKPCMEFPNLKPDYLNMSKKRMDVLREELMRKAWHPSRLLQCIDHDDELFKLQEFLTEK